MKTYEVAGKTEVLGHSPGKTFDADLTPAQELLIEGGALREVTKEPDTKKSSSGEKETYNG